MQPHGLMITGTDTGVGKTFVACGLAAALVRRGLRVAPFKPVETGCEYATNLGLVPADALLLKQASGCAARIETICPYRFRLPLAPWVAAQQLGEEIDPSFLARQYQQLAAEHELVIVETAGGILVPLGEGFHFGDLARLLNLPVLVVAASKLGAINHTLLTLEYLRAAGLTILGVVLNQTAEDSSPAARSNEQALRKLIGVPLFAVPQFPTSSQDNSDATFDELADHVLQRIIK